MKGTPGKNNSFIKAQALFSVHDILHCMPQVESGNQFHQKGWNPDSMRLMQHYNHKHIVVSTFEWTNSEFWCLGPISGGRDSGKQERKALTLHVQWGSRPVAWIHEVGWRHAGPGTGVVRTPVRGRHLSRSEAMRHGWVSPSRWGRLLSCGGLGRGWRWWWSHLLRHGRRRVLLLFLKAWWHVPSIGFGGSLVVTLSGNIRPTLPLTVLGIRFLSLTGRFHGLGTQRPTATEYGTLHATLSTSQSLLDHTLRGPQKGIPLPLSSQQQYSFVKQTLFFFSFMRQQYSFTVSILLF